MACGGVVARKEGAGVAKGGNNSDNTHGPWAVRWATFLPGGSRPHPLRATRPHRSGQVAAGTCELDDAARNPNRLRPRDDGDPARETALHPHVDPVLFGVRLGVGRAVIRCRDVAAHGYRLSAPGTRTRSQWRFDDDPPASADWQDLPMPTSPWRQASRYIRGCWPGPSWCPSRAVAC